MSAKSFSFPELGKSKKFSNVEVRHVMDLGLETIEVYLHNNLIVKYYPFLQTMDISNCNWVTPTTRQAINTALKLANFEGSVWIKDGRMLFGYSANDYRQVPGSGYIRIEKTLAREIIFNS